VTRLTLESVQTSEWDVERILWSEEIDADCTCRASGYRRYRYPKGLFRVWAIGETIQDLVECPISSDGCNHTKLIRIALPIDRYDGEMGDSLVIERDILG
jgi:hypothetical protein